MKRIRIVVLLALGLVFCSCNKDIKIEDKEAKEFLDAVMDYYYYWNTEVPNVSKELKLYSDYFNAKLVPQDRWSFMQDREGWNAAATGVSLSYGMNVGQALEYYKDYSIRVKYVFPDSPMSEKGVKRGWVLTHIAGQEINDLLIANKFYEELAKPSNSFTFRDLDGNVRKFNASAREIHTKSYLCRDIFDADDKSGLTKKVGYFNYKTFNGNMLDDINETFSEFSSAEIDELILDLRYNGGGESTATNLLANYIAPASADGKILAKRKMNDNLKEKGSALIINRVDNALELDRIFIITGGGTASASEIILNGLKPLFGEQNVIAVGDTTYGKPTGMYAIPYPEGPNDDYYSDAEYVFLPICFFTVNADGKGDYLNGINPSEYMPEDIRTDWGPQELLTSACLEYIVSGTFPDYAVKSLETKGAILKEGRIIKTEESDPNYGRDIHFLHMDSATK